MAIKVTDRRTRAGKAFELSLLKKSKQKVYVGIPGDSAPYPDGTSVADVAAINEFGAGRVPARPFLIPTINENFKKYTKIAKSPLRKYIVQEESLERILSFIGAAARNDVVRKINTLSEPPNAPLTIALKGSDNPLIDTGHMRSSVTWEIEDD